MATHFYEQHPDSCKESWAPALVSVHKALLMYSDSSAKPFIAAISRMSLNGQRREGL